MSLRLLEFGVPWGPGLGWRSHACAKNHPWVGGEVCAKFGGDWSGGSGVKEGHRYIGTNSLFFIYIFYSILSEMNFFCIFCIFIVDYALSFVLIYDHTNTFHVVLVTL